MFDKLKALLARLNNPGMLLPIAHNPSTGLPSVTLTFAYVTFVLAVLSTIALHFKTDLWIATSSCLIFWTLAVVFYRMGKLDKVKLDLDDRSIELESEEEDPKTPEKED